MRCVSNDNNNSGPQMHIRNRSEKWKKHMEKCYKRIDWEWQTATVKISTNLKYLYVRIDYTESTTYQVQIIQIGAGTNWWGKCVDGFILILHSIYLARIIVISNIILRLHANIPHATTFVPPIYLLPSHIPFMLHSFACHTFVLFFFAIIIFMAFIFPHQHILDTYSYTNERISAYKHTHTATPNTRRV